MAGALAEFFALAMVLQTILLGNVGRKGVRWLAGYFMGYYTIWLALVKKYFVPFWELREKKRRCVPGPLSRTEGAAGSQTPKAKAFCPIMKFFPASLRLRNSM